MTVRILLGDVRAQLARLPDDHFDIIVTSPPYWGLRDYGVEGQIGLEPTLGQHLAVMVDLFRDLRRVLKPTGTLWLNYGDCYATSPNGRSAADTKAGGSDDRTFRDKPFSTAGREFKAKDLCMAANRLAIALQDDGWWVRGEFVWGKTNPMPESVTDRPGTAHEKIFLLTKGARYFYDAAAVRKGAKVTTRLPTPAGWDQTIGDGGHGSIHRSGRNRSDSFSRHHKASAGDHGQKPQFRTERDQVTYLRGAGRSLRSYEPAPVGVWPMAAKGFACELCTDCGAFYNRRDAAALRVEEIVDGDRRERRRYCRCGSHTGWLSHFATFPPELVERCLSAACPTQACATCGAPWVREVEKTLMPTAVAALTNVVDDRDAGADRQDAGSSRARDGHIPGWTAHVDTKGFRQSCGCASADVAPARVLDPFGGAGTTAIVADAFGADCTLIELNGLYATLAMHRIADERPESDIEMGSA